MRLWPIKLHEILFRRPEVLNRQTFAQMRGNGSEHIAPVKSLAQRFEKQLFIRDLKDGPDLFASQSNRQDAVVRPYKEIIFRLNRKGCSVTANARVNHRDMDGVFRKKPATGSQRERSGPKIARRHAVR